MLDASAFHKQMRGMDALSLSRDGAALVRGLLNAEEEERLGAGERLVELMNPPWLARTEWERLLRGETPPPWIPAPSGSQLPSLSLAGEEADVICADASGGEEREAWKELYASCGPTRTTPWQMEGTETDIRGPSSAEGERSTPSF